MFAVCLKGMCGPVVAPLLIFFYGFGEFFYGFGEDKKGTSKGLLSSGIWLDPSK